MAILEKVCNFSIIIPVYNGIRYTRECIESIRNHTSLNTAELIIIDNGSTDETPDYLKHQSELVVITNSVNKGFPAAVNQGLRRARGEYFVVLNNDIAVPPGWLEHFRETIEATDRYGVLGPVTNYISGLQMVSPVPYSAVSGMYSFARKLWEQYGTSVLTADTLRGFCMVIRRDVIEAIGGFDERFKIGNYEDDDFCLRAQRKGFLCGIAQGIFIHHYGSATFKTLDTEYAEILRENVNKFTEKWNLQPPDREAVYSDETLSDSGCKTLLDEGNALAAQGQYEAAIEKYRTILKSRPNHIEALHNVNAVLFQIGKRAEALEGFQTIIRIDPSFSEVHFTLGAIAESTGDYAAALRHYRNCISHDIEHNKAYEGYARAAEKTGIPQSGTVDFVFYTSGIPFDGSTIKKRGLGGSESALYYIARCIAQRGYSVAVFNRCEQPGTYDGVEYRELVDFYLFNRWNSASVFISSRSFKPVFFPVNASAKVIWLHDMPDVAYLGDYDLSQADLSHYLFFTLSRYQTEQWREFLGINEEQFHITRNGFDPERFLSPDGTAKIQRKRNKLIYSSRPNRGLDVLLDIFPKIRQQIPDAELHIFTYSLSEKDREYEPYLRKLHQPGVIFRGSVPQEALAREMMEARLVVYPSTFKETSCITAIEAQAAGTPVVTTRLAALPETVADGISGILIDGDARTPEYQERFISEIVRLMQDDGVWENFSSGARQRAFSQYTWEIIAQEWIAYFVDWGILPPRFENSADMGNPPQTHTNSSEKQPNPSLKTSRTPKLSLCMIVKNEEKTLPVCLESVKNIVDEIIIVDTGSTDKTIEIAQSYGAKVHSFEWVDDFSAARNESLQYAVGDWILYLDADERISPDNAAKIREVITNSDIAAVNMIEHIPQEEGNLFKTVSSDYCRLFRNDPRIRFTGRVHEQILPAVNAIGGKVLKSSIRIEHWGYAVDESKRQNRAQRNLNLLLNDAADNPDDPFIWFNIGLTYKTLGSIDEAVRALKKAVEIPDTAVKPAIYSSAHTALAQIYFSQNDIGNAEKHARMALTFEENNLLARYILAGIAFYGEHYEDALQLLQEIMSLSESGALAAEINAAQIYVDIGNCLYKLQRYSEAADVYKKAAALDAHLFDAYFNAGVSLIRVNELAPAHTYLKQALAIQPDNTAVQQLIAEIERVWKQEGTSGN